MCVLMTVHKCATQYSTVQRGKPIWGNNGEITHSGEECNTEILKHSNYIIYNHTVTELLQCELSITSCAHEGLLCE